MTGDVGALERRLAGRSPRYGVLCRVKNECDVVEAFVRHHAALVDRVIVVDNLSQDGTRAILRLLEAEGLPLTVLDDEMLEYRQAEIMSYLARAAFRAYGFDRLFLLDADEFLAAGSRADLDAAFAPFGDDRPVRISWRTYVPDGGEAGDLSPPRRIAHRRIAERRPEFKVVLASRFAERVSDTIAQGNHDVVSAGVPADSPIAALDVAHFPVRSRAQLATKAALAWTAYVAMGYDGAYGAQWKSLASRDASALGAMLRDIAFAYPDDPEPVDEQQLTYDPIPHPFEMRYPEMAVPDPLRTVAGFAEQVARRYAAVVAAGLGAV